ncbi:S1 family peptidase [uncultured Nocardioides sp.]|uniref:S1 family peptidase n=1 Tax=uncultured Nocardioides sp. TaxID=198441 RepID=UPI00261FE339|nr:S1 family peptidase [uncultured Nocardioides sp.]
MGSTRTAGRRLVAVTATLGIAASLTAAFSLSAAADETGQGRADEGSDVLVREAPSRSGSFVVRARTASADSLSPALMEDLRTYARSSGENLADLVDTHRGVDEFAAYLDSYARRNPDQYVTGGIAERPGGKNWIQTTTRPGADEVARLEKLPVDVEVSFGAPASYAELETLSQELVESAGGEALQSVTAGYDAESQTMDLEYTPAEGAASRAVEGALDGVVARAGRGLPGSALPLEVTTTETSSPLTLQRKIFGGRGINSNKFICTAGFTAKRKGRPGIITSGHCPNRLRYLNKPGTLKRAVKAKSRKTDLQYNQVIRKNGNKVTAKFRYKQGRKDRVVRKVANAPRGSTICKWGRTSGYNCSKIRKTNICGRFTNGETYCGLDQTRRKMSSPGDSGGPNFSGNTARGITTGGTDSYSLITRVARIDNIGRTKIMKKKRR